MTSDMLLVYEMLVDDILESEEGIELLSENKLWVKGVKTKWDPPKGFFTQSASKIVSGLMSASKDKKQAMSRLNFYINRAGKSLSTEDKSRLEKAKDLLSKK